MSRRLQRFRAGTPHAEIAKIAEIPAATTNTTDFGNNGKFGRGVANNSEAIDAAAFRGFESALAPIDDEAELTIREEPVP